MQPLLPVAKSAVLTASAPTSAEVRLNITGNADKINRNFVIFKNEMDFELMGTKR